MSIMRMRKMIEEVLQENPSFNGIEARNSDISLTILIWQKYYGVDVSPDATIQIRRLYDLPREDNVKRLRAIFQNEEHKYLPTTWEVAKKRKIARDVWEAELGYKMTADEMYIHKQNVLSTTPPVIQEEPEQAALLEVEETPKKRKFFF